MAEKLKIVIEGDNKKAKKAVSDVNSGLDTVTKALAKYTAAAAVAGTAFVAFKKSIQITAQFESAISDLSAITGASGEDLKFLSDAAKEMGATTTKSASEAAEAMKLVASAKPDLLANADALTRVTKEALTLAEAAGATLPEAANTLGSSLNQFGAEADQAGRFINVLAAGAKEGASEINETSAALKESGTVASAAGISFESVNAAIQAMSTVAIKGSQAGTNLRNIILKLQTQTEEGFNPAVVGLEKALKNLQEANLDTTELTKLFGLESVTAAQALINQADNVAELTDKLTDTNTAYDQASIKTDNMAGDMAALTSAIEGAAIEFGEEFGPTIREVLQTTTELIRDLTPVAKATAEAIVVAFKPVLLTFQAIGDSIDTFQAAAEASDAKVKSVINATKAFNKVLRPNRELLKELGVNIRDIDPRNVDAVNAALSVLNKHAAANNTKLITRNTLNEKFIKTQEQIKKIAIETPIEPIVAEPPKDKKLSKKEKEEQESIEKSIAAQQAKWDRLEQMAIDSQLNEEDREIQRHARQLETIEQDKQRLIDLGASEAEIRAMAHEAEVAEQVLHNVRLLEIEEAALNQRKDFRDMTDDERIASSKAMAGEILGIAAGFNKDAFILQKNIALATTAVSLPTAVIESFENGGGYPWGLIPAALMAARGAAEIATITGTSYTGQAHAGLDTVPEDGTFLLRRDEMVLDPGTSSAVRNAAINAASPQKMGHTFNFNFEINNPLSIQNWKEIIEEDIAPRMIDAVRKGIDFGLQPEEKFA